MKGLILKDFINLRKYVLLMLGAAAIYAVLAFVNEDMSFLTAFLVIFSAMLPITSFAYDDMAKWDAYALSAPVSRRDVVLSKYIFAFLCLLIGAVVALLFVLFTSSLQGIAGDEQWVVVYTTFVLGIAYIAILLPLLFKFGAEKGRYMGIAVLFGPFLIFMLLKNAGMPMPSDKEFFTLLSWAPLAAAALYVLSFFVSKAIYRKKEI
ncbi:ABC-2 transporter permease [Gehongia tenuis]|uniref:ABC-2 transporter permease n=1 Tax=Gehongia tenuis TaxID=2763655 RepID=A0A926D7A5_9FIRM|nr:ABC-2 transporter permease [Gehongia tenuis]MBC8531675.1 ABC-2 transporter permease [Gehongia tenuis]